MENGADVFKCLGVVTTSQVGYADNVDFTVKLLAQGIYFSWACGYPDRISCVNRVFEDMGTDKSCRACDLEEKKLDYDQARYT